MSDKYKLQFKNDSYQDYKTNWELVIEDIDSIHFDKLRVNYISSDGDSIIVSLNKIPARVDIEAYEHSRYVWVFDDAFVLLFPKPYKQLDSAKAYSIWIKDEGELATIKEVGEANDS